MTVEYRLVVGGRVGIRASQIKDSFKSFSESLIVHLVRTSHTKTSFHRSSCLQPDRSSSFIVTELLNQIFWMKFTVNSFSFVA
jgi:hypothetical protein